MDEDDEIIEKLILTGALEIAGIDTETGDFLYNFTDNLAKISPEIYKDMNSYFYSEMVTLWENGFIEMDITDTNPKITLTDKILDNESIKKLDRNSQHSLKEIIRILKDK
jgi:hypothetical protein